MVVMGGLLLGCAGIANAHVTLNGASGLFINPTADVMPLGTFEVNGNYQRDSLESGRQSETIGDPGNPDCFGVTSDPGCGVYTVTSDPSISQPTSGRTTHSNSYALSGAIGIADKLELNGGYHRMRWAKKWNIGGKYQVAQLKDTKIAVGGDYNKWTKGGGHLADVYAAATHSFPTQHSNAPIEGTLGLRYNDFTEGNKVDVFGGVKVPFTRKGDFRLIGELGSKRYDGGKSQYAVGVDYLSPDRNFNVGVGFGRHALTDSKHTVFLQLGYRLRK